MGDKRKMKLSGELDYRIRYDVEHDLFHAQNVFNDEYITPTFVEYVRQLEAQIEKMKCPQNCKNGSVYNWSDSSICMDCEKVRVLHEDNWQEICKGCKYWELRS